MTKQSYNDPKKSEVHQRWKRFIRRNLPGNPSEWAVVCMPYGDEGQSYEMEEVYRPLGVSEGNIIAIERNKRHATVLKRLHPHMEVFEGEDTQFFEEFDKQVPVIGLDYDGTLTAQRRKSIGLIAGRQLLTPFSVLGVAISGKREQGEAKLGLLSPLISAETLYPEVVKARGLTTAPETLQEMEAYLESIGYNKSTIRDSGITAQIIGTLMYGNLANEVNPAENMERYVGMLRRQFRRIASADPIFGNSYPDASTDLMSNNGEKHDVDIHMIRDLAKRFCSGVFDKDDETTVDLMKTMMIFMAVHASNKPYIPHSIARYGYRSVSSAKMIVDFFALKQRSDILDKYNTFLTNYVSTEDVIRFFIEKLGISPRESLQNRKRKTLARIKSEVNDTIIGSRIPERINLGSSYRPRLTGQEYYRLRVEGRSDEEIMQLRRTSPRQLAAFKAHVTMGTYGTVTERVDEPPQETAEKTVAETGISVESEEQKYSLSSVLPRKFRRHSTALLENAQLRMQYFIADLYGIGLGNEQTGQLLENVKESRWYENVTEPTDTQVYSFFDDLTLCARNGCIPTPEAVKRIYHSVVQGEIDAEVKKYVTQQTIPEHSPILERTEKRKLTKDGVGKTMLKFVQKKKPVYPTDIAETSEELPIVAMLMANWNKEHPEYGLVARINRYGGRAYIQDPAKAKVTSFADSHGISHPTLEARTAAEQGYR